MLVVGLTGGIASGKSTASYLISSHPAKVPIIDLDVLAREVVAPGQPALAALRSTFGPSVINESDGTLNRAELGRLAFATPEKTKLLNKITHGAIRRRMVWKLLHYWMRGEKVVVVDTPLLVEAGLWKYCGELVLVYCRKEDQLTRMLKRDGESKGLTEEDAKQRLAAQLPLDDKLVYADMILDNSANLSEKVEEEHALSAPEWTKSLDKKTSLALRVQVDRMVNRWVDSYSGINSLKWLLQWVPPCGLLAGAWRAWRRTSHVKASLRAGTRPSLPASKL
ncbi:related to CAB5 - probable dephospho-CoA kinase [Melanopsichium pennsylvanicum]|uniref:Dephospho-kinase n=2 Tax=Melanopsichium pennsylvanicum TaxID=63383 RepID=A0A077QZ17_9BASI|nr:dephospho-kinase [Melanopsichium pennsylvanicum 4]SNX86544.1 related to CAB5 - probable dephospho-CoA kinase [Melanopsichium pennsylvanicum]